MCHDLADARLTAADGLPLRHAGGRGDLRRHALDLLDTAVVVAGVDHGLLFGHLRLVLFLGHADGADAATVEELPDHGLVAGQQHLARAEHHQCLRNSMPMLSGTVRAMLMLCVTIRIVASICALMSISSWVR